MHCCIVTAASEAVGFFLPLFSQCLSTALEQWNVLIQRRNYQRAAPLSEGCRLRRLCHYTASVTCITNSKTKSNICTDAAASEHRGDVEYPNMIRFFLPEPLSYGVDSNSEHTHFLVWSQMILWST